MFSRGGLAAIHWYQHNTSHLFFKKAFHHYNSGLLCLRAKTHEPGTTKIIQALVLTLYHPFAPML
jgi:hypothetical protein